MSNDKHFFLRDHWKYDPGAPKYVRKDAGKGMDTKSLHSGFHPYQNQDDFRSFTPPLIQSVFNSKQATEIFSKRCHIDFRFVQNPADPGSWAKEIDKKTKLIWIETPSNPCLFITDIKAVSDAAHAKGVPVLVDNTTATGALQRPMNI